MFSTTRACKAADADGDGMIDYKDCSHGLDTTNGTEQLGIVKRL